MSPEHSSDDVTAEGILAGAVTLTSDEVRLILDRSLSAREEMARVTSQASGELARSTDALVESTETLERVAEVLERRNVLLAAAQEAALRRWAYLRDLPTWAASTLTLLGVVLAYWLASVLGVPLPLVSP